MQCPGSGCSVSLSLSLCVYSDLYACHWQNFVQHNQVFNDWLAIKKLFCKNSFPTICFWTFDRSKKSKSEVLEIDSWSQRLQLKPFSASARVLPKETGIAETENSCNRWLPLLISNTLHWLFSDQSEVQKIGLNFSILRIGNFVAIKAGVKLKQT